MARQTDPAQKWGKTRLSKNLEIKIRETKDLRRGPALWARCHGLGHDRAHSILKARLEVTMRCGKVFWSLPGMHRSHPFDFAQGRPCRRARERMEHWVVDFAGPSKSNSPPLRLRSGQALSQRMREGWGTRPSSISWFLRVGPWTKIAARVFRSLKEAACVENAF